MPATTPEIWLVIPLLVSHPDDTPDSDLATARQNYFAAPTAVNLQTLLDFAHVSTQCQASLDTASLTNAQSPLFQAVSTLSSNSFLAANAAYPTSGCGQDVQFLNLTARNIKD
jgi:hypothetical protein